MMARGVFMTDWAEWFRTQLKTSGEEFVWAFQQIESVLYFNLPPAPHYLGLWPPLRHVWHVAEYERWIALPSMRQWLGDPIPNGDAWPNDDEAWSAVQDRSVEDFIADFQAVRQEQIALIDQFTTDDWTTPRETIWDPLPLRWVVMKTYQHTWEHGDTLLRMALQWRRAEEAKARDEARKQTE
jgi:hypothetical protein